jgi:hypothetical protein
MVARQYATTPEDITGKKRSQQIALPRQIAMYICRRMTPMSTTKIGTAFGGRDHTTVMHSCDKVAEAMDAGSRDVILVFAGEGGTRSERVREALEKRYPRAEVILQSGGQPVYEYILVLF